VIRRGVWLAAGAVLGVAGYRRVTRLVDGLARGGSRGVVPPGQHRGGSWGVAPPGQHRGDSWAAARRTVRGTATVSAATADRPGSASQPAAGRPASTVAKIAATASFVRDVRDGMAEYLELHHRELARNLGSRSNRTPSG
jgi:hypothetical protein